MHRDTALACDGPLNGTYIDHHTAETNGYHLGSWSTGEEVYFHAISIEEDIVANPSRDVFDYDEGRGIN